MRFNQDCNWKPFYGNMKKAVPMNAPEARDKSIVLHLYVDADYAGDKMTCRSCTGFIIYLYAGGPINWYSKKQNIVGSHPPSAQNVWQ
jgi:hypothetical protein